MRVGVHPLVTALFLFDWALPVGAAGLPRSRQSTGFCPGSPVSAVIDVTCDVTVRPGSQTTSIVRCFAVALRPVLAVAVGGVARPREPRPTEGAEWLRNGKA